MVDYKFEDILNLDDDNIQIIVRSNQTTPAVTELLEYLAAYQAKSPLFLPIKTKDRIDMIKTNQLLSVEVDGSNLVLETLTGQYLIKERLYKFQNQLKNSDFVQVSKQCLININYLEALENSFSGNMVAFLRGGRKIHVSRWYLKNLEKKLGL